MVREQADTARAYWATWAATLVFFVAFYALLVPLPRYLAEIGLADWQIGLILGAFGVASLVGRPIAGVLVDRWGTRPVLLVGAAAFALGAGLTPLTEPFAVLAVLRVMQAVGYVAFTTAGTALVIQLTPLEERGGRLAIYGAAANVAISLAPLLGSLLLATFTVAGGFWLASGLAVLAGAVALVVGGSGAPAGPTSAAATWRPPRELWVPMGTAALFGAGFAAFFLFSPILSERRGVPDGVLYSVYGAGIILTRIVGSRRLDRVGTGAALYLSVGLLVVGYAVMALPTGLLPLAAATLLVACGSGLFHPVLIAHHARILPDAPGRATAGFYLGFDLGIGLGSWLLGLVLDRAGLTPLYVVAALLVAATLLFIPALSRQTGLSPAAPG